MLGLLTALGLGSCGGGGGAPDAVEWLHEDTFLVVHVDVEGLMGEPLWEDIVGDRSYRRNWQRFSEQMEEELGFAPEDVRSVVFSGLIRGTRAAMAVFVESSTELDLTSLPSRGSDIIAEDDDGGAGRNAKLDLVCQRAGRYRLEVGMYGGLPSGGRVVGSMGDHDIDVPIDRKRELIGPLELEAGDRILVATQSEGDPVLYLHRLDGPSRVEGREVHRWDRKGGVCQLDKTLYLFSESLPVLEEILEQQGTELEDSMRDLIAAADWSGEATLVVDLMGAPADWDEELERELERELDISRRRARSVRDVDGLFVVGEVSSDELQLRAVARCDDEDGAEDFLALIEDILYGIQEQRGTPRFARRILDDVFTSHDGSDVRLTLVIDSSQLEDLVEARIPSSATDAPFEYATTEPEPVRAPEWDERPARLDPAIETPPAGDQPELPSGESDWAVPPDVPDEVPIPAPVEAAREAIAPTEVLDREEASAPGATFEIEEGQAATGGDYANSLHGLVTDDAGRPIQDAVVALTSRSSRDELVGGLVHLFRGGEDLGDLLDLRATTRTDAQGRYFFSGVVPLDGYHLTFSHEGHARVVESDLRVGSDGEHRAPDVIMTAGGALEGTITNPLGEPIPGAHVELFGAFFTGAAGSPRTSAFHGLSDAEGRYQIRNIHSGVWTCEVRATGWATACVATDKLGGLQTAGTVELHLTLTEGCTVSGSVVDTAGSPIPGVRLVGLVAPSGGTAAVSDGVSGEDGRFEITSLPEGECHLRIPRFPDFQETVAVPSRDVVVALSPQSIEGRVVDAESGSPITGFHCSVHRTGKVAAFVERPAEAVIEQVETGRFRIERLSPSTYVVEVQADGYAPGILIDVLAGTSDIVVNLGRGGTIRGRVLAPDGRPVEGALVACVGDNELEIFDLDSPWPIENDLLTRRIVRSDQGGRFLMERLTPGQYMLKASSFEHVPAVLRSIAVESGEPQDVEVVLLPGGTVSGLVTGEDGAPLRFGIVNLSQDEGASRTTRTDGHGRFLIERVPPGSYSATARSSARAGEKDTDAFQALIEMNRSRVPVVVEEGATVVVHITLGSE